MTSEPQWIEIDGTRLEIGRWGEPNGKRLPILLLHEGLGSVRLWKQFPERLAAASGRQVIAWSRRGHGWSEGIEIAHRPDYMHGEAHHLPALHAALGLGRAHWLGHSDGGSIALIGAASDPRLAASLILEAPHVFVEPITVAAIGRIAADFPGSNMADRMRRYHAEPVPVFERWRDIWLDPAFLDWNIEALLPAIRAPALLIQGHDDQYGTMAQLDRIDAVIAETTRLELDRCGHSPHFDREDAVVDAICGFLDGRD